MKFLYRDDGSGSRWSRLGSRELPEGKKSISLRSRTELVARFGKNDIFIHFKLDRLN
jgi:hypothetical protein